MSRLPVVPVLALAWFATVAASPPLPPVTPTPVPTPTPTPTPTSNGQLQLSVALGPPGTIITVSGSGFRSNEPLSLYWDSTSTSLGQVNADAQGSFKQDIAAPKSDPGQHAICVIEPNPQPICAVFKLEAAPTPSPSDSPTPTPTAVPSAAASPTTSPTPVLVPDAPAGSSRPSAISALLEPPFVIFPVLILLALVGGCGYWIWLGTRPRPRPRPLPASARVMHTSVHPPIPGPPPTEATAEPAPAPPPPPDLPAPRPSADDTLDLPQPGD